MNIAYYLVLFLHVVACLFLIGVVLLQQGKSQDLASAFGGGGTQTAFGPRGSANVLSRATTVLAGLFMVTSLALSMLRPHESSILDRVNAPSPAPGASAAAPLTTVPASAAPATTAPASPATTPPSPAAREGGGTGPAATGRPPGPGPRPRRP
jgi:preprotein translocase subunit SecG